MPDITLTLNENEQQVFLTLLDSAVRQTGLQGAEAVFHFSKKVEIARKLAETPLPKEASNDS